MIIISTKTSTASRLLLIVFIFYLSLFKVTRALAIIAKLMLITSTRQSMWRKLNKLLIIIRTICFDKETSGQRQQSNQALQAMMNNFYYSMQIWLCYPSSQGESADVKSFWSPGDSV